MTIKSLKPNLSDLMTLYLLKLRHLVDYYINLFRDLFDKIRSSHIYSNYIRPIY